MFSLPDSILLTPLFKMEYKSLISWAYTTLQVFLFYENSQVVVKSESQPKKEVAKNEPGRIKGFLKNFYKSRATKSHISYSRKMS